MLIQVSSYTHIYTHTVSASVCWIKHEQNNSTVTVNMFFKASVHFSSKRVKVTDYLMCDVTSAGEQEEQT